MSVMHQGEIYLVAFSPSIGHEYRKVRPALIIAADSLLRCSPLMICCPITSNNQQAAGDEVPVVKDACNKLTTDSTIKTQHVYTFDKSRMHKYIGYVGTDIMQNVKNKLRVVFNL